MEGETQHESNMELKYKNISEREQGKRETAIRTLGRGRISDGVLP